MKKHGGSAAPAVGSGSAPRCAARSAAALPCTARRLAAALLLGCAAAATPSAAQPPAWCPEPEARQFDFWLGEWDVQNRNRPAGEDDWAATGSATDRVYAVVGGCAIIEHWRGYAFPAAGHIVGFSVRGWDPAAEQWELVLLWPIGAPPRLSNYEGRFRDGRGEFHSTFVTPQGDTAIGSLNFHDITEDAFVWSNGRSLDGGETWESSWMMHFTRRPPTATGLWNGPSMTTDRCPEAEHRAFDAKLGEWAGTRVDDTGDSTAVRTHLVRILEGCAVMQRTWTEDGAWESFAVRAYEPADSQWVEYAVASDRRRLHRREGEASSDGARLTDVEAVNGGYIRTRWENADTGFTMIEEVASSPDGPWRPRAETRLFGRVGTEQR